MHRKSVRLSGACGGTRGAARFSFLTLGLLAPLPIEGSILLHLGTLRIPYCPIMYPHSRELIHNPPFVVGGDGGGGQRKRKIHLSSRPSFQN